MYMCGSTCYIRIYKYVPTHICIHTYNYRNECLPWTSSCWSFWASSAFMTLISSRFTSPPRNCSDGGGRWTSRISACGGNVCLRVRSPIPGLLLDMSMDPNMRVCVWVCVCVHMYIRLYMYCYMYMCYVHIHTQTNVRVYLCLCGTFRRCP